MMGKPPQSSREGSLEAPTRYPLNWQDPEFYNETPLFEELERVYESTTYATVAADAYLYATPSPHCLTS
jgi:hypothetical protein